VDRWQAADVGEDVPAQRSPDSEKPDVDEDGMLVCCAVKNPRIRTVMHKPAPFARQESRVNECRRDLATFMRNSGRCLLFNKRIGVTMQEFPSIVFLSNCLELGARRSP
jgi:hypothetical protein